MEAGRDKGITPGLDKADALKPLTSQWWFWVLVIVASAGAGFVLAVEWPSLSRWDRLTAFLPRFVTSSGFGAIATVVAALLALIGVGRQVREVVQQNTFARRHADKQATDAEWWKGLEWVTARVFPGRPASRDLSLPFAVELVAALHDRSRSDEQRATSFALLNELNDAPGVLRDPIKDKVAETRLASMLGAMRVTPSVATDTAGASELLFELQCRRAFEQLRAEGIIDRVLVSTGATDSGADAELFRGSRRIAVEMKRYRAPAPSLGKAAAQVRRAAQSDEALLIVTPEPAGDSWPRETLGVTVVAIPEDTDVVDFLVAQLREVLA